VNYNFKCGSGRGLEQLRETTNTYLYNRLMERKCKPGTSGIKKGQRLAVRERMKEEEEEEEEEPFCTSCRSFTVCIHSESLGKM